MKVFVVCISFLPFLAYISGAPAGSFESENILLGHERELSSLDSVGQGVDAGPSDIGHELHAKMEEAAQKALVIIEQAGKYLDEATKDQEKKDGLGSYKSQDIKDWEKRDKRSAPLPVPQTNSEAAKGRPKRAIDNFDLILESEAVKAKRETKKSKKVKEDEGDEVIVDPKEPAGTEWWDTEAGLTPDKLDKLIDAVNKMNDLFSSFIKRYDEVHGTVPETKDTTTEAETPAVTTEAPEGTEAPDASTEGPDIDETTVAEEAEPDEKEEEEEEEEDDEGELPEEIEVDEEEEDEEEED